MAFQGEINLSDMGFPIGVPIERTLEGKPVFWGTFTVEKFDPPLTLSYKREEDFFEWFVGKAHLLDRSCEETTFEESSLDRERLAWALMCGHRDVTPEALSHCHQIANVISVSCFLFCLRIGTFEDKDGSVIDKSGLIDHLASLVDNWKWSGEKCRGAFDQWIDYIEVVDSEMREEALKLLYEWALPFLSFAFVSVQYAIQRASIASDDYAEVNCASKWGDELCDFLEEYRMLFKVSDDNEFFYDDMYYFHCQTTELHLILGKHGRARKLLEALREVLNEVSDRDDITVADWRNCKDIAYIKPDPIALLDRKINVLRLLNNHGSGEYQIEQELKECEAIRKTLGRRPKVCYTLDWSMSLYTNEIYRLFTYFGEMRLSHGRECFKDFIGMKDYRSIAFFCDIRSFLYSIEDVVGFIRHSCTTSTLTWEAVLEKQDFLLDVCEALGDRQLTAKYLAHSGWMIYNHYAHLFEVEDTSTARLRLQEGLNLQLTSPMPECVQDLISALNDPCGPDEHKRENLPDLLKGFRLINSSIKTFSDLLHSWTHGTSKKVEWLKLLESQKGVHSMMLAYHRGVMQLCNEAILTSSKANLPLESRIVRHSLICKVKPPESAAHGGSNLSAHHVFGIAVHICLRSALVWVERGRARMLMKQLGGGDGPYSASLKGELIEFDNNYQAAESSIRSCHSACKGDPLFIEYHCSSSELPPLNVGVRAHAFAVVKSGTVHESLLRTRREGDELVETLVDRFYDTVPQLPKYPSVIGELHSILEELYDMLVGPVLKTPGLMYVDPNAMLVFVPDKTLYRVPFSLLRDKTSQKYLFQLRPIAISPSLRVLQHCERRWRDLENFPLKPDGCILAVGNATYKKKERRLPGTGQELERLKECFLGRVKTLQEDEATRAKFLELVKQANRSKEQYVFACIHLGVHGHWSKTDPVEMDDEKEYPTGCLEFAEYRTAQSYSPSIPGEGLRSSSVQLEQELVMNAASSADDEIRRGSSFGEIGATTRAADFQSTATDHMLPSEDIVNGGFQWRTPLVVLSACNSSRGQDYSDGEVNLPRALMIAGVPAAVVSQWKIGDLVSPRLMEAFYKNLKCGQNVARALQSAMMQLSAPESGNADNIFEWGPFLVWGLPTVQLPRELWTENARKALPAREKAELLRSKLNDLDIEQEKLNRLQELQAVDHFLEYFAACDASTLGDEAIKLNAVIGLEELLSKLRCQSMPKIGILEAVSALAEQVYAVLLPLEEMKWVELELEKRCNESFMVRFWAHMMYTQAMRSKHEIALAYCNKLIEVGNKRLKPYNGYQRLLDHYMILRLMGKYEEAFEGLDSSLAQAESYECLMQTSYLKYLMKDEIGALVYALRAKRMGDAKVVKPTYGKLDSLVVNALPDEAFYHWFSNVDESALTENARKALAAKEQVLLLSRKSRYLKNVEVRLRILNVLKLVDTFVASVYNACAIEENAVVDAILTVELLLSFKDQPLLSKEICALIEGLYTIFMCDQWNWVELELGKQPGVERVPVTHRLRRMYMQAMKGSLQIALDYADKMIEIAHNADGCGYAESIVQCFIAHKEIVRQERAVVLRLTGKYDEALKEFEDLLAAEPEDYECLIQTSYLKHLMEDESGALEYALRAKKIESPDIYRPGYGAFMLGGFKTLPNEYRLWLLNIDNGSVGPTSSSVAGICTVQPPPEVCAEKAILARAGVKWQPLYTPNCPSYCTEGL